MSRTFRVFVFGVLLSACDAAPEPLAPAVDVAPTVAPSPRVHVLNTQLRGIINPDIEPSTAYGHVQVRLEENTDGSFTVHWKGRIFNPAGEAFLRGSVGPASMETDPFLTFFRLGGEGVSCAIIDFDSQGLADGVRVPADIALGMIVDPEIHEARLFSVARPDGAVAGSFGIVDPATLVGFNPQPDPPTGRPVRCAI